MPRPKKSDNTAPLAEEPKPQTPWKSGTDLRDDKSGLYRWPQFIFQPDDAKAEFFPSVTTVLDTLSGGMRFAEAYFAAEAVVDAAKAAIAKAPVKVWHDMAGEEGKGGMVDVRAVHLLSNQLDGEYWGKDAGLKWVQFAGMREMTRRANRGSIVHDAVEDWAYGNKVDYADIPEYCATLIQARGFTISVDYVSEYVAQALLWCEKHVIEVLAAEFICISRRWGYAGTGDLIARLRDLVDIDPEEPTLIDFKASKAPQPTHEYQQAAYFFADWVGIRGTDQLVRMPKCKHAMNVYVQPDTCKPKHWRRIEQCKSPLTCVPMKHFIYARQLWQDMNEDTNGRYKAVKPVKAAVPKAKSREKAKPMASEMAAAEYVEGQGTLSEVGAGA